MMLWLLGGRHGPDEWVFWACCGEDVGAGRVETLSGGVAMRVGGGGGVWGGEGGGDGPKGGAWGGGEGGDELTEMRAGYR